MSESRKEHLDCYNPDACCKGSDCYALGLNADEPCWGDVDVEAEEHWEDDWCWIHACQGHQGCYGDSKAKYQPKE